MSLKESLKSLTLGELKYLSFFLKAKGNYKEVAKLMSIEPSTVKAHQTNITQKLLLSSKEELMYELLYHKGLQGFIDAYNALVKVK